MAAGGMGPRAFAASCSFALVSFARASGGARALDWAAGCPLGAPWGRGARVEVRRVLGVGGVVPMAAGGMGPSCLRRIMFLCSGVFCQGFRKAKSFRSGCWLPLGSAMGPRCACRGEAGGKCGNKNFADRRPKNIFPKKEISFKKSCFHELKGPSECSFPILDQEPI